MSLTRIFPYRLQKNRLLAEQLNVETLQFLIIVL